MVGCSAAKGPSALVLLLQRSNLVPQGIKLPQLVADGGPELYLLGQGCEKESDARNNTNRAGGKQAPTVRAAAEGGHPALALGKQQSATACARAAPPPSSSLARVGLSVGLGVGLGVSARRR